MNKYLKLSIPFFSILSFLFVSCRMDEQQDFADLMVDQEGRRESIGRIDQYGVSPFAETRLALDDAEMNKIAPSNDYTFDFFRKSYEEGKNMLLCPLGFQMTLAMTGNIANDSDNVCRMIGFEGEGINDVNTYFMHLLGSLSGDSLGKELKLANAFMTDIRAKKYPDSFLNVLESNYLADYYEIEAKSLEEQPCGSRPEDAWCKEKTAGMIDVAPFPIMEYESSILNVFSFAGEWQDKFDKDLTKNDWFYVKPEVETPLSFMNKQCNINYYENDDFRAVSLPFSEGVFDLSIILPKTRFDVAGVLEQLDSDVWDAMRTGFGKKEIKLSVPLFSASYSKKMKIGFPLIEGVTPLDEIGQKSLFQMNEEGASASAVTQGHIAILDPSRISNIEKFFANNPFIYTISESGSGLILFIGTYCGADK